MPSPIAVTECSADEYAAALSQLLPREQPVSFCQAPFYGAWQASDGKAVTYFAARSGEQIAACGVAVKYDAPGGISFLYAPYGPVVAEPSAELLAALQDFFRPLARRLGVTFVRLDADTFVERSLARPAADAVSATASLQPRAEWLLDISAPTDELFMGMHKHGRYTIRLAERAEAVLQLFAPADAPLDTFYELMQTTGSRDRFGIMGRDYYQAVLSSLSPEDGFVAICSIDGRPAAAALFITYDRQAHYVFAGSSNDFRKIAPPYFLIWHAILESKKRGCTTFNFGGITDPVKSKDLQGVTSFKKRFGGYEVDHPNPVDLVYKPVRYAAFKLYKAIR